MESIIKRKKILIGSVFVLVLLLLLPSIPAIQQRIVEERTYNKLVEHLNLKDISKINRLERIRHPLLYFIVSIITTVRLKRGWFFYELSTNWDWHWPFPEINHPLLYLRSLMLLFSIEYWVTFWAIISIILRWNWPIY